MPNYFKPWRRKIGVVTLVIACAFAAGWVRSDIYADNAYISDFLLMSLRGGLYCFYANEALPIQTIYFYSDSASPLRTTDPLRHSDFRGAWNFKCFGFGYGIVDNGGFCRVPYWSIVIPLTLLSAHLLLSKPRVKSEKQTADSLR